MYGRENNGLALGGSEAALKANLAAQLQALDMAGRSQQLLQLQQMQQQQQRRAITGHQQLPASVIAPNVLHQQQQLLRQPYTNLARTSGNDVATGLNAAGWGASGSQAAFQQQQLQQQQRGNIQHGRSMSVQNISMSGNYGIQSPGNMGRVSSQVVSATSGDMLNPSLGIPSKYGNGKMIPDYMQMSKVESNRTAADLIKNLTSGYQSQLQGSYDGQKLPSTDASWLDLMRYSQDNMRDHNSFLDVSTMSSNQWDNKQLPYKGLPFPYGFADNLQSLNDLTLSHSMSTGLNTAPRLSSSVFTSNSDSNEVYSRKVFVGGLPPDIDEDEIMTAFQQIGPVTVDWPHKAESKSYFPPKGYCFLLFQDELSVQALVESCRSEDGKLYWGVSSPTMKDKLVQIRPWKLDDSDFVMDGTQPLDPRKTVFVGGVPRPLRAVELAVIMSRLYGSVCYAGIDTDPDLKYPKGAGRVAFSNQQSYIAAISARFVQLQHGDIDKRVEVKPYVLDDQICDECQGALSGGKYAPYFCANVMCLQYYCEPCWSMIHSAPGREFHKPLMKEGADRPRAMPRWS